LRNNKKFIITISILIFLFNVQQNVQKDITSNHLINVSCPESINDYPEVPIIFSATTEAEYIENIDITFYIDDVRKEKISISRGNFVMYDNFKKELFLKLNKDQTDSLSSISVLFTSRDKYGEISRANCMY
jgi:hypothetical protein